MSAEQSLSQTWKTPNELIKLHRFKLKQKALNDRLVGNKDEPKEVDKQSLLEAACTRKRKNPFAKTSNETDKKQKTSNLQPESQSQLFNYNLPGPSHKETKPVVIAKSTWKPFDAQSFANIFNEVANPIDNTENDDQSTGDSLPIDWSLKSRIRILCETELPATNLKTNQEASGLTGFVRCVDRLNITNNLDISLGARFHQCTHYWQHPHLPWLALFPRNSKSNIGFQVGERERESLVKDWTDSFRGLFQLLRARQCPYFYLCANSFTVLFRAAGVGGRVETHALMSPTSRGMRSALKQEEIEYLMPLKREKTLNRSKDGSFSNSYDEKTKLDANTNDEQTTETEECEEGTDDDDEEDGEKWLERLGVNEREIKKISSSRARMKLNQEMAEDFSDNSIILIEGGECQAFFNFLLNAKSTITAVGRLAGVPPTLLSPVAFPKATMETLTTRSSKVRSDGSEYFSLEIKGTIMPHVVPYINTLLRETKDAFSLTLAAHNNTLAFSKASQKLIEDIEKENLTSDQVFQKENLSDCGLQCEIVESMCKVKKNAVCIFERMCFSKEVGFMWS